MFQGSCNLLRTECVTREWYPLFFEGLLLYPVDQQGARVWGSDRTSKNSFLQVQLTATWKTHQFTR